MTDEELVYALVQLLKRWRKIEYGCTTERRAELERVALMLDAGHALDMLRNTLDCE